MPDPADTDPLAELREQVRATTQAAQRLAAEATGGRGGADGQQIPPAGWASAGEQEARAQELQALVALVEALRDLVPDELKAQVRDVLRQLLLLTRALIDWWVERMDAPAGSPSPGGPAPPTSREIPID